jgi:hypothetical protein
MTQLINRNNRLVILIRRARFVANRQERQLEVPWIYNITRLDDVLRTGENSRFDPRIRLAGTRR